MSLYQRLHSGGQPSPGVAAKGHRFDPVLDELRQRIHQQLIEELGPILYDSRLPESELRKKRSRLKDDIARALRA